MRIGCDPGSAQPIADCLKEAYEILEAADGDPSQIKDAVKIASDQIAHLYHQQSTYSGSAAAIPHLFEFASLADLQTKTFMLVMIACMDYDHAGAHAPGDLYAAYAVAIQDTYRLAVTLLETTKLSNEQQDNLFEAVTLIDNSCNFVIQNQGCGNHACTGCKAELMVEFSNSRFTVNFQDGPSVTVEPPKDLNKEFEKERHRTLA